MGAGRPKNSAGLREDTEGVKKVRWWRAESV